MTGTELINYGDDIKVLKCYPLSPVLVVHLFGKINIRKHVLTWTEKQRIKTGPHMPN